MLGIHTCTRRYLRLSYPVLLLLSVSALAQEAPPGAELIYRTNDPELNAMMETSWRPIISPDGRHLYLGRTRGADESAVALFTIDSDTGEPALSVTYQSGLPGVEDLPGYGLTIREFNAAGTRAYATFGDGGDPAATNGVQVLERNTTTGELRSIQTIIVTAETWVTDLELSPDGDNLYVSTRPTNSLLPEAQLRTYNINAANGLLADFSAMQMPPADALSELQLIDEGTRLLASSTTELLEFERDIATGALSMLDRFSLPPLFDGSDDDPGPVAFAVTASGEQIYTVRSGLVTFGGGYINTLRRNPNTGLKTTVAQLEPTGLPPGILSRPFQILLSDDEQLLFTPWFHGIFSAGSPSPFLCVSALARNLDTGALSPSGTDCSSGGVGPYWVVHPQRRVYYTRYTTLRQTVAPFAGQPAPGGLAIWQPGRVVQPTSIHAAVLPLSRTISERGSGNSEPATFFAAVLNDGDDEAIECVITPPDELGVSLRFQRNDPDSNTPLDPDRFDRSFNVPAGGLELLTLTIFASNDIQATALPLEYRCSNTMSAPQVPGVNHPILSAANGPLPDMVTGTATTENNGIARLPSPNSTGFFAASTINIGAPGLMRAVATFDLSELTDGAESNAELGSATLRLCETRPDTGECLDSPAEQVEREFASDEVATYTVFIVGGGGEIPFDPARNRVYLAFIDAMGEVRGASSVAVTTVP